MARGESPLQRTDLPVGDAATPLFSDMRFSERLRRLWWWASGVARRAAQPPTHSSTPAPSRSIASNPPDSLAVSAPRRGATEPADVGGRVVVGGEIEVRMWTVEGLVILATGWAEAERALVTLLSHADPEVRAGAGRLADQLRSGRPAAA